MECCVAHGHKKKHDLHFYASHTFIATLKASLTVPQMDQDFGKRLRAVRKERKLSMEGLAAEMGVSYPAVQQWETGKTFPATENLLKLGAIFGPDFLLTADGRSVEPGDAKPSDVAGPGGYRVEPNAVFEGPVTLPLRNGPRDVEERGITVGGFGDDDSAFEMNGQIIDMVTRPPGIANRQGVFALRVANESMVPKFEDGERVYVEPRKAAIGEYVVIELYPRETDGAGKSFIKRLVSQNSGRVTVEQFNPRGRLEFERDEVRQILRVIPTAELLGI